VSGIVVGRVCTVGTVDLTLGGEFVGGRNSVVTC
jgi:hypothetical protein